jgi:hypothetical protein
MPSRLLSCATYLPPVRGRQVDARVLRAEVATVNDLFAAVDFNDRRDHRDDVVADALHERIFRHDHAIRHFHQHFRTTGFSGVHAAGDVVDRLRELEQFFRACFGRLARIGELVEVALVLLEVGDGLLVRNREDDHVATFFGLADVPVLGARRSCLGNGLHVAMDVGGVRQVAGLTDDAFDALELERGRDLVRRGQMVDQFGRDAGIGEDRLDAACVFLIDFLRALRMSGRCHGKCRCKCGGEQSGQAQATRYG